MLSQPSLAVARQLMQRLARRPRRGFTLIELLVVVVIIGILASIALPSFVGAQDKARNASVQANVNTVRLALEQYSTDHNGAYPSDNTTAFGSSATGIGTNNYLPGNKIPKSPWATTGNQAKAIDIVSPMVAASLVAGGNSMPSIPGLINATKGSIADPPSTVDHYGAIEYNQEPASQTYTLYATGKRNKDSIVTAESTNNGS